jgi:hypothetical protein
MVQRIQKARSRHEFEREERLASETLGSGGNKGGAGTNVGGAGGRRNTARGAENTEPQDYDEENLQMAGGTEATGETQAIKAGTYEEDYGDGLQGRREEGQVGATARKPALRSKEKTVAGATEDQEDFPTGKWSRQKARATLSKTLGNAKATKASRHRPDRDEGVVAEGGNRGRRSGETGTFRGRNAGGNRPRHTGLAGRAPAAKGRGEPRKRGGAPRRAAGSQARGGPRKKAASSPATARRKTVRNEGG